MNYIKTINDLPMDPKDDRLYYGVDFANLIDDGGTFVNPTAEVSANDSNGNAHGLGINVNNVSVSAPHTILFRPSVDSGDQEDTKFDGDGIKVAIKCTIENATGQTLQRSGYLWIAQR